MASFTGRFTGSGWQPSSVSAPWQRAQPPKPAAQRGVFARQPPLLAAPDQTPSGQAVRDSRLSRLEAVLLLAGEPLSSRKLAQFASLADGTEARTLVRGLNRFYDAQGSAFRVEEVAGGFQLLTRTRFAPWLRRLYQSSVEIRLSSPALETLAVVAYRQPVLRAEIEAIRGVQSGEMIRQLMERDLVRITGRSPELGRPFLYGTTRRFLRMFGLRTVEELPRVDTLRAGVASGTLPAEENPNSLEIPPGVSGDQEISTIVYRQEESEVKISAVTEPSREELLDRPLAAWRPESVSPLVAAKDDDDDDIDDDDEEEEDDDEEEDDLEEDEWEEVDDEEFDEEDEDWDEDEDWEDDDEEEDDDDDWEDDDE